MLHDFTYYNPTKIYFGKDAMQNLSAEIANYGENILLLYGKNSIKKIGLYDEVVEILQACNKNIIELSGIKPRASSEILDTALPKTEITEVVLKSIMCGKSSRSKISSGFSPSLCKTIYAILVSAVR